MTIETLGGAVTLADGTPVPLSKAVRAGDFIFLSGQLAFGSDGRIVQGGIAQQTRQCLTAIEGFLQDLGAQLTDVVRATVWLTDTSDFTKFNAVYAEFFPESPPSRSTVCSGLMLPDAKVEIEVTVFKPKE